jgi:hypothetical protein
MSYESFLDFIKVHKIQKSDIDKCFGFEYFNKNPMYDNCRCINRIAKCMGINIKVKTKYTTNTVKFIIK